MAERRMPTVEDYPSNANGAQEIVKKEETKPIERRGKITRKHSFSHSLRDEFISDEAPNVGSYILYDILIPALRDLFLDISHGAIDVAFGNGGGSYRRGRRSRYDDRSYISYDRMYDDRRRPRRDRDDERYARRRANRDLDEFTFEFREDAEDVLDRMCDYIERYGDVPVSYFYDLCGETVPGDFTSDDWGWTNLSQARVSHGRRGYFIDFPRCREL